jgi:xanthine dehydrogenase YagT iron-sulfur-binding subunit
MKKTKVESRKRTGVSRRTFVNTVATGAAEVAVLAAPGRAAPPEPKTAPPPEMIPLVLRINDRTHNLTVEPRWTLQYVLRDRLGLTATKDGCERGECGACSVLIDGLSRYSCMTLAIEVAGCQITTPEGLMHGEQLGPVQQAFVQEDAFQCGYCTPGQTISVEALLRKTPQPTLDQIREGVSGNLCRCGAYNHIFRAAHRAAEMRKAGRG